MTPRKPNYPYDCPLLLSKDDVKDLRQANVTLAQIATMLAEVKEMTTDNQHTLRGHNGDDGLIARLTRLEERLNDVTETVESLKDVPGKLEQIDALKDVPTVIEQWITIVPIRLLVTTILASIRRPATNTPPGRSSPCTA